MIANESVTQPGVPVSAPAPSVEPALTHRHRHWYRRPLRVIPLVLLGVLLVTADIVAYRTLAAFDSVHSLSTPPPELSGAALVGDDGLVIDTGPAQGAVRQQQVRDLQQPESSNDVALIATQEAATDPLSTSIDQPGLAPAGNGASGPTTPSAHITNPGDRITDPPATSTSDAQPQIAAAAQPPDTEPVAAPPLTPIPVAGTGGTTILLMGVDARDGESIDVGVRPDALAILHLDDAGSCRMLAIPRDSRATLPGYGSSKINHALAVGGIPYAIQVVEGYLGVEIDHYGLVDFTGITQIVDSVGGIDVDNPTAFAIADQTFAAGTIKLDGERALLYSRYRGGADGDFGRIAK